MSETQTQRWIELDGADNVRDLGGLPTEDDRRVQPGRLIRSDSLQDLTPADVRRLVDDVGVRAVADLRTGVEVAGEGPGPMTREPDVRLEHLSLFPEPAAVSAGDSADGPIVLPWQEREESEDERRRGVSGVYLRYLDERADSVLAALRLIAGSPGATLVHCAAGKDRTGVVVALALAEAGVTREAIVADYAASAERVEAVIARLARKPAYAGELRKATLSSQRPRAVTMDRFFSSLSRWYGGPCPWLRQHGWTEQDALSLRVKLLQA